MKNNLAIAYAVKQKNKKAHGGMIKSASELHKAADYELGREKEVPSEHMNMMEHVPMEMGRHHDQIEHSQPENLQMHNPGKGNMGMKSAGALKMAALHELGLEANPPSEPMEHAEPKMENKPAAMMAHGGMMHPKHIVSMIMDKKKMADGGLVNEGEADGDLESFLSDEDQTEFEGGMGEDRLQDMEEDPMAKRKKMLSNILGGLRDSHMNAKSSFVSSASN